jgi:hypothetical protein
MIVSLWTNATRLASMIQVACSVLECLISEQQFAGYNRKIHRIERAFAMKREDVLQKLAAGELSVDEASQLLAENEQKRGSLYCKVSQKGALSVYGLQRMPVTLYVEQWERLLDFADEIRSFAEEHKSELSRKK